ncbi:MAG: metallophosphoesterase [Clostridiales bacterium]
MKIFALGDLHLSLTQKVDFNDEKTLLSHKPMDIFGDGWFNHTARIYKNWQETVGDDDVVLVPGDISWAMTLEEAKYDFDFLGRLKGRKILLRGNHDYWWHSPAKIRKVLPPKTDILQNEAVILGDIAIAGTRLWSLPDSPDFSLDDQKIFERELIRLELSLEATQGLKTIVMFHYMPTNEQRNVNEVIDLLSEYNVIAVVYGHLHGGSHHKAIEGNLWGMDFSLTSGDYLNFTPKLIAEI